MSPTIEFIRFGAMDVTKPYEFIKFGAMDGPKPHEFIKLGAMDGPKPYEFIGFGAMDGPKPYEFIGFGAPMPHISANGADPGPGCAPGRYPVSLAGPSPRLPGDALSPGLRPQTL